MKNKKSAEACTHCHACQEQCEFLKKYGIDIGDTEQLEELAYHCFLCGKCTEVCPEGIDGRAYILELRRKQVEKSGGTFEKKGYGMLLKEKRDYIYRNYRHANGKSILFPGCNFPSFYPKTTRKIVNELKKYDIGVAYDCCGKPMAELGMESDEKRIISRIQSELSERKIREVIMLCPNCYTFLKPKLADVKIISIYEKLEELLEYQIANSTDAIVICGTTGEASTLTHEEHVETIRFAADYVKKRVPVIAGTGSNCTETAIWLSQEAQKAGVDGCLVVTPYYNKATQKGLIQHYTAVAKSVDLPIIMYNVPGRTGCNIQPETAAKLAKDVDNIVAIKAATGNLAQESKTMALAEGRLDMYSGEDGLIVPLMSIGAKGVISVLSNVAPKQTHDICATFAAGDVAKAAQLQFKALELVDALFCEVNPIPVKHALNLMGWDMGPLRSPLCEMEEANLERLKKAMVNYGIL